MHRSLNVYDLDKLAAFTEAQPLPFSEEDELEEQRAHEEEDQEEVDDITRILSKPVPGPRLENDEQEQEDEQSQPQEQDCYQPARTIKVIGSRHPTLITSEIDPANIRN